MAVYMAQSATRRRVPAWPLALLGLTAVAVLVRELGASRILAQIETLGSVLPLVLLITAGKYPLQTAAWRLALPARDRPPFWRSLGATLAGDSVGYLTFAGPVTGEPARALLLRAYLAVPVGIAVGGFERAVYTATGTVLVVIALVVAASRINDAWRAYAAAGAIVVGIAIIVAVITRRLRASRHRTSDQPWRAVLHDLWRNRRGAVAVIVLFGILEHALLALEAGVMLHALGAKPTVALVIVFEGLTKTLNSLGSIVPARLGVSEAGSTLLTAGLGVGASLGLSMALMRRARALLWSGAGVVTLLLFGLRWRQVKAASADDPGDVLSSRRDDISARVTIVGSVERNLP